MIIIGYPGIGKSTVAKKSLKYIDLESSSFDYGRKRMNTWFIPYCNIAEKLSNQGYVVFVSSHPTVREYLGLNSSEQPIAIYPETTLKNEWIEKLKMRMKQSPQDKNKAAYYEALKSYDENIEDLKSDGFDLGYYDSFIISRMDYSMENIIKYLEEVFE